MHNGGAAINRYRVRYMADDTSEWSYNAGRLFDPREYVITGLNNGTYYDVQVQARNSETPPEYGAWSPVQSAMPVATGPLPEVTAPRIRPAANGIAMHSITVEWPAVFGAAKYQVQHKLSSNDWPEVDENAPGQSSLSYQSTGLDADTNYRFRVRAYGNGTTRDASWGPWSRELSASTLINFCVIQVLGTITDSESSQGIWSNRCESENRDDSYAKHFNFTLASASTVTIELVSAINPYLFLMSGQGISGPVVAENDDSRDNELGYRNSRITYEAAAGTYTAEATTFTSGATGDFTIEISVASAPPTNAPPAFRSTTYSFSIDENEANGHEVGTVAATDSDGNVASYSLDDTSLFSISNTGVITVAASLEGQGDEPPASLTVTATDDDGGTGTATVSITVDDVLPSAPRNVVLTPGNAQINVAWTAPEHNGGASIDAYRVRHRTTAAAASWNYSAPLTVSPYIIERLDNGTVYEVEVQARNSLQPPEFGHWSDVETTTPVAPTLPSVAAPGAPSKAGATSSSITVSWSAVTGAAKYQVRYKTGTNDWTTVEVAAATRYTAQMLDASTTYRFEVSAYGDGATRRAGWGGWSMHLDASSDAAPTMSGCTTTLGSISGTSTLQGTWTDECVSSNRRGTRYARYFTFELATAAELTIELVSVTDPYLYLMEGAGTSGTELAKNDDSRDFAFGYSDSRITYEAAAGTYTAEATTYGSMRTGGFTITIDAVPSIPSAPTNVRVVPGNNRLVVLWDAPASDGGSPVTGYRVEQEAASGSQSRSTRSIVDPSRPLGVDDRGYAFLNLTNGTLYSVTVKAVNANGDGAPATATATPQETTIMVTASASMELAEPGVIGVRATNTVQGADYKVRLSIDDETKVSFGGCEAQEDVEILSDLTSTAIVQACSVGTANITALLVVQDISGGYQTLAASDPHEFTVRAAAATFALEVASTGNSPEEFEIGESAHLEISAASLNTDTPYYIEVNSTDREGVGFDRSCGLSNRVLPSETSGSDTSAMHTVDIYACGSLADGEITAELKRGGVVVNSASISTAVQPAQPTVVRANGKGSQAGRALLRFDPDDRAQSYKIQYKGSDGVWREQNDPYESNRFGYRTIGARRIFELEIDLTPHGEYSIKAQAVRTDRGQSLPSEWSEEVYVWVAQSEKLPDTEYTQALTNGWTYKICPGESAGSGFGLNASTEFANWNSDIAGAIDSWEDKVIWTKPDGSNIISASSSGTGNCADGSEYTNNIVKGIDDHPMMRRTCFKDAWDHPNNQGAVACAGSDTPTSLTKLMIFWTGWTLWNPGAGTDTSCSLVTWSAAHEAGHVFGFADHLDDDTAILDSLPPTSVCEPGPRDVMALMSLYQSVGN